MKKIKLEISQETAKNILDVLKDHQVGYSVDFASDRITNIRKFINELSEKLVS